MTEPINFYTLRSAINRLSDRAGNYPDGPPIIQDALRNQHLINSLRLAELELPTMGYDVTPVFNLTLLQSDEKGVYRNIRNSIRRAIHITETEPSPIDEPSFTPDNRPVEEF